MNPFDYFDRIFCINLDSRLDRWNKVQIEFEKAGIFDRVERMSAMDIPDNPAMGNHLSHALCIREGIKSGANNILIFEDDIEWLDNPLLLKRIIPELTDWDILYLGVNTEKDCNQVSRHLARLSFAYSTHAYAINKSLFEKILAISEDPNTDHNDVRITKEIIPYYKCYATIPLLAGQRNGYSDIQKDNTSYNSIFLRRFEDHLKTLWFPTAEPTFVTFVTPTIGRKTLQRAVDSVIRQHDWDWKHIVMFDGREINFSSDNDHVLVTSCERKNSAGLTRNEAMKLVTTDWIAFLDDDDWLETDYIENLKRYTNYDIVIFTYRDVVNNNTQPPIDGERDFRAGNVGISFAIKTDFVIKHNIQFCSGGMEDFDFLDQCRSAGATYIKTNLIKYFVGGRGEWRENV